jgi:hypothetical protein
LDGEPLLSGRIDRAKPMFILRRKLPFPEEDAHASQDLKGLPGKTGFSPHPGAFAQGPGGVGGTHLRDPET